MTTEQQWLGNDPILTVPDHILALPEDEQGPALVQAIHERKGWTPDERP